MKRLAIALLLAPWFGCTTFKAVPPDGFAVFEGRESFLAVSADGVTYRVRHVDSDPDVGLDFWTEALKRRMQNAGYVFVEESAVHAGGEEGYQLLLAAPYGHEDYSYLIALFMPRGVLVVVESAGSVTRFDARRAAIDKSIAALKFGGRRAQVTDQTR